LLWVSRSLKASADMSGGATDRGLPSDFNSGSSLRLLCVVVIASLDQPWLVLKRKFAQRNGKKYDGQPHSKTGKSALQLNIPNG
jgi:hypothetical protein